MIILFSTAAYSQQAPPPSGDISPFTLASPKIDLSKETTLYYPSNNIEISGEVEAGSKVTVYVNNPDIPYQIIEDTASGGYRLSANLDRNSNSIKLVAEKTGKTSKAIQFSIAVDKTRPGVTVRDIPQATREKQIILEGSADEEVNIKVIAEYEPVGAIPPKITGLKASKVEANAVTLEWNAANIDNFKQYAIYRSDVNGVIDYISTLNQLKYEDRLVNSSQQYIYQISAINNAGAEGPKSEPVSVTVLSGGAKIHPPARKDTPSTIEIESKKFPVTLPLELGDGKYKITIQAEDRAGNSIIPIRKEIIADSTPPTIEIITPEDGTSFFQNVANRITVKGKTEPNAEVKLFVITTIAQVNRPAQSAFGLSGIPNEIQELVKSDIDTVCRSSVCKEGNHETKKSDANGNFEFNVDLTPFLSVSGSSQQQLPADFRQTPQNIQFKNSALLLLVAKDQLGQLSQAPARRNINIGTCSFGQFDWAINTLTQYPSPFVLSPERIQEGSESLYFYFQYQYRGAGANARITDVQLSPACGNSISGKLDSRYERACSLLGSFSDARRVNSKGTMSYHALRLSPLQLPEQTPEKFKDYIKGFGKEVTFPFILSLTYTADGKQKFQTSCEQVSYVLDDQLINPKHVLPDWLLTDFVDYLDDGSKGLQKANEAVRTATKVAAAGCLGSSVARFFTSTYRRYVELVEEIKLNPLLRKANPLSIIDLNIGQNSQDKAYCQNLVKGMQAGSILSFKGTLKDVNDIDLKRCFKKVYDAWQAEEKAYQAFRFSCDRLLGKSAPSRWTESATKEQISSKLKSNAGCPGDLDIKGVSANADRCRASIFNEFSEEQKYITDPDLRCAKLQPTKAWEGGLYKIGKVPKVAGTNIFELSRIEKATIKELQYALKQNENNYLLPEPGNCEEICAAGAQAGTESKKEKTATGWEIKEKNGETKTSKGRCLRISECQSYMQLAEREGRTESLTFFGQKFNADQYKVTIGGYAEEDCFYEPKKNNPNAVSPNPNLGMACCCVVGNKGDTTAEYFKPADQDSRGNSIHESKNANENYARKYEDMEFSYRYYAQGFKTKDSGDERKTYDPNRYISGRDFPACFGQDNQFLKLLGGERYKDSIVLDPARQHEAAFQCVALSQIGNRLRFMTNIMDSMSACLKQVKANGKVDTGSCKELFSQHLCGLMWQVVKAFTSKKCSPYEGVKVDPNAGSGALEKTGIFTSALQDAVSDVQSGFENEYNNAQLNQFLGLSQGSVARKICLGAFGYDWNFGLDTVVDLAYTTPFATFVQAIDPKRTYLVTDPTTGEATYEYRTGYLINPGCELDYTISLSCVGQRELNLYPNQVDCSKQGDLEGSNCDCLKEPFEKPQLFRSGRRLEHNTAEDESYRLVAPPAPYRYDHIKFELRPDAKITPELRDKCFPSGYTDSAKNGIFYFPIRDVTGRDILDCSFDTLAGQFKCEPGVAFEEFGTAQITKVGAFVNGAPVGGGQDAGFVEIYRNEKIEIEPLITNQGKSKCMRISVTPSAKPDAETVYIIAGGSFKPKVDLTRLMDAIDLGGLVVPPEVTLVIDSKNNVIPVSIDIIYEDVGNNGIDISPGSSDKISIPGITQEMVQMGTLVNDRNGLIIEKDGLRLRIISMALKTDNVGKPINPSRVRIESSAVAAQPTGAAPQQKIVTVSLFNPKSGVKEVTDSNDCDFNNPVKYPSADGAPQERKISISIRGEELAKPAADARAWIDTTTEADYLFDDKVPAQIYFNSRNAYEVSFSPKVWDIAKTYGVNYLFVKAMIGKESGWDINAVSKKNAIGLMQVIPDTAKRIGCAGNWNSDPASNIECGVKYITVLMKYQKDKNLRPGLANIVGGYHCGEGGMDWSDSTKTKTVWEVRTSPGGCHDGDISTKDHVNKVMPAYEGLKSKATIIVASKP